MSTADSPVIEKKPETIIAPPPKMFNVVILNNTVTDMTFVVGMLTEVFNMNRENATRKMMEIHQQNRARIGPYTKDVAETKKDKCLAYTANAKNPSDRELVTLIEPAP
jgi:ATP-dependent Clp protease adaptor protein ClpS